MEIASFLEKNKNTVDGKVLYRLLQGKHSLEACYQALYDFHTDIKMIKWNSDQKDIIENFLNVKKENRRQFLKDVYSKSNSSQQISFYKFSNITKKKESFYYKDKYKIIFQNDIEEFLKGFIQDFNVSNVNQLFQKIQDENILGISKAVIKKNENLINKKCLSNNIKKMSFYLQDNKLIDKESNFEWKLKTLNSNLHSTLLALQKFCLEMSLIPNIIYMKEEINQDYIDQFKFFQEKNIKFEKKIDDFERNPAKIQHSYTPKGSNQINRRLNENEFETDFLTARNEYFNNPEDWFFISQNTSSIELTNKNDITTKKKLYYPIIYNN